jgi:hypothetical protein
MSGKPPKPDFRGMTTNERLMAAGLLDDFDAAAKRRDRAAMIELFDRVDLAGQAPAIADAILADPARYGY